MTRRRIRKLGLWSGMAAFVAFGLTIVGAVSLLQFALYLLAPGKEENAQPNKRP